MPIPVVDMPVASFGENFVSGLAHGSKLVNDILAARKERMIQKNLPQTLDEQLKQLMLATRIKETEAKYAEPKTLSELEKAKADIRETLARSGLYSQQEQYYGPKTKADIAESLARAKLYGAQADIAPERLFLDAMEHQRKTSRFGASYAFINYMRLLTPEQRDVFILQHPEDVLFHMNNLHAAALEGDTSADSEFLNSILQKHFPEIKIRFPTSAQGVETKGKFIPAAAQQPQREIGIQEDITTPSAAGEQELIPPLGEQLQSMQGITPPIGNIPAPEEVRQFKNITKISQAHKLMSPMALQRIEGAQTLEQYLGENREMISKAAHDYVEFAGVKGKGRKFLTEWSSKKENQDKINNYQRVKDLFLATLENYTRRLEGMGLSAESTRTLQKMFSHFEDLSDNPKRALTYLNNTMANLISIANSTFKQLETAPGSEGIAREFYKIPEIKGNYILPKSAVEGNVMLINQKTGDRYNVPKSKAEYILKKRTDLKRR